MLVQFSFSNYKSFKEEAFLDLVAEPIEDNEASLIIDKNDGERFLPVIAIYGPNGGGKSTVLEALGYLRTAVLHPVLLSQMQDKDQYDAIIKLNRGIELKRKYHKFDLSCQKLPITFDIMFRTKGKQYRYQFAQIGNVIMEENLYQLVIGEKDADIIFERSAEECVLGDELEGIAVEKLKSSMPLLSHAAINYDIESIDDVINWFVDICIVDYDSPKKEYRIILPSLKEDRNRVFEMLQKMDIRISDFRMVKDSDGNIENIYTKHILEDGTVLELPFEEESAGTRKLFSCLAEILHCLKEGRVMVADELDAKLHPKLLRYIIELFTDPKSNKYGAQLLLTSHDITTMTSEIFRKDEIWFCALNPYQASSLYSLVAFKSEKGQGLQNSGSYGKQYIEGRYGADPYIRKILDWED